MTGIAENSRSQISEHKSIKPIREKPALLCVKQSPPKKVAAAWVSFRNEFKNHSRSHIYREHGGFFRGHNLSSAPGQSTQLCDKTDYMAAAALLNWACCVTRLDKR